MHTFHVDGLEHSLRVVRFTGDESISQPFRLEITVVCDEHNLAPGHVVGRPATLGIHVDGETRLVHGIVSRFARGSVGKRRAEYRVTVVPAIWRLRLRTDSRIFQGLTVPEILADVLARSGFQRADDRAWERREEAAVTGYQMALGATYLPRENCVQYRESDRDFINRLMEEEGIHYFFEHDESSHVLVVSDAPTAHEPIRGGDAIAFRPSAGAMSAGEHVARFHFAEEVRPARVVLSDYSFERPMLPLGAAAGRMATARHSRASNSPTQARSPTAVAAEAATVVAELPTQLAAGVILGPRGRRRQERADSGPRRRRRRRQRDGYGSSLVQGLTTSAAGGQLPDRTRGRPRPVRGAPAQITRENRAGVIAGDI